MFGFRFYWENVSYSMRISINNDDLFSHWAHIHIHSLSLQVERIAIEYYVADIAENKDICLKYSWFLHTTFSQPVNQQWDFA